MKVHVIEADLTGTLPQVLADRDTLGRDIVELARSTRETVYFHNFIGPVGGAPIILLECSDAFLAQVRKLPSYKKDQAAWTTPGLETERSPKVQAYFASKTGPDCKIIPPPKKPGAPKP
jgi:hypothetical protein